MSRIHYRLKKHLYGLKFYRRKGFGIHSPFVFHLITRIIEARPNYPVFQELQVHRKSARKLLKAELKSRLLDENQKKKYREELESIKSGQALDRLAFRLMNFSKSKNPAFFGPGFGVDISYLAKVDSSVDVSWLGREELFSQISEVWLSEVHQTRNITIVTPEELHRLKSGFDFVVFSERTSLELFREFVARFEELLTGECMVIIQNIHKNKEVNKYWLHLKQQNYFSISFDLFHVGILIARKGMQKQDYVMKYRF